MAAVPARHALLEAYGVTVALEVDGVAWSRLEPRFPPGWREGEGEPDALLRLVPGAGGELVVELDGEQRIASSDEDLVLRVFETELTTYIGLNAPGLAFIHAGCVAVDGRAVLIPGRSFSGKTTLVAELVRQGATYLSDDYAPIDRDGLVHPYPRPLWVREEGGYDTRPVDVASLGGERAAAPCPVGLVVFTQYRPGARWAPNPQSRGAGALALVDGALAARTRSEEVLALVTAATRDAEVLMGERGDAGEVAAALIERLRS